MNIYLEMMLAPPGVLHCDPHPVMHHLAPASGRVASFANTNADSSQGVLFLVGTSGNLLRTSDGKLCILDWGLVTTVRPDLQLTLIEHVAHLTASDYAKVPSDLVKLGFVPEGDESTVIDNGVVDFLTDTYSTWKSGGGAAKLDVPKLFSEVRELAADTPGGIFQVPPYFAYIAKSFSVLEGIGLSADPNYSIVDETLPYISQRIISDPSPRTAGALETFIFGDAKDDRETRVLDADRVATLVDGAKRYTDSLNPEGATSSTSALAPAPGALVASSDASDATPVAGAIGGATNLEDAADAILDLLLTREPSPLQEIAIEQSALLLGPRRASASPSCASCRHAERWPAAAARASVLSWTHSASSKAPLWSTMTSAIGRPWRQPQSSLSWRMSCCPGLSSGADGAGAAARGRQLPGAQLLSQPDLRELSSKLLSKLWARRDDLQVVTRRLAVKVLDQTAQRAFRRSTAREAPASCMATNGVQREESRRRFHVACGRERADGFCLPLSSSSSERERCAPVRPCCRRRFVWRDYNGLKLAMTSVMSLNLRALFGAEPEE